MTSMLNTYSAVEELILNKDIDLSPMNLRYEGELLEAFVDFPINGTFTELLYRLSPYSHLSFAEFTQKSEGITNIITEFSLGTINAAKNIYAAVIDKNAVQERSDNYLRPSDALATGEKLYREGVSALLILPETHNVLRRWNETAPIKKPLGVFHVIECTWGEFEGTYAGHSEHSGMWGEVVDSHGVPHLQRWEGTMGELMERLREINL